MAEIARSRIGVVTYLVLPGLLAEGGEVEGLRVLLEQCMAAHELRIVLDFANVLLIGSEALECLLQVQDQLTRLGGALTVSNASACAVDVLRVTGLDSRIRVDNEPERDDAERTPTPPRPVLRGRLGEVLTERGLVSAADIDRAMGLQQRSGRRLGHILVEEGLLDELRLLMVLGEQFGLPFVRLRAGLYDPLTVRLLSPETATRLAVAPLFKVRDNLYLATNDAQAIPTFDTVAELTGAKVKPVLACTRDILATIKDANSDDHDLGELIGSMDGESEVEVVEAQLHDYAAIDDMASGSPVVNLINGLIQRAVRDGASDIHIEPGRTRSRVRFRIDGILYQVMTPPVEVHPALVSRLKVMANLDIAERRLPQDGRVQVYTHGRTIDLRFSSLPGIFGEKVVLRVLDKDKSFTALDQLGMSDENLQIFRTLLGRSHGLLLVTGPTGSGKTTTLYGALGHLNSPEKSIVTIEDPVEYQVDLINQNQVKEQVGLSFARILKHVLRQDPDIVMVGEIRERETAEIAVQAALTGHLVLSTLHTNDSAGAITRLLDMGIEPFLLSSALAGVMAQRLVRMVCPECRTWSVAPPGSLRRYGVEEEGVRLASGRGCAQCYDSGYRGRVPIHELLVCDERTQQVMVSNPSRDVLAGHIRERGVKTLLDAGVAQAVQGTTTLEEVARVVNAG